MINIYSDFCDFLVLILYFLKIYLDYGSDIAFIPNLIQEITIAYNGFGSFAIQPEYNFILILLLYSILLQ